MTTNRPYIAIRDYFNEKDAMGILTGVVTTRSVPPDTMYWSYPFCTLPRYYLEVLCPGLAQVCCLNHVSPRIFRPLFRDEPGPTISRRWIIRFYPNATWVTRDSIPKVTKHLRESRDVLWKPGG